MKTILLLLSLFICFVGFGQIQNHGQNYKQTQESWDYEGTLTVGTWYSVYQGFVKNEAGSIAPTSPQVPVYNETVYILVNTSSNPLQLIVADASSQKSCNTAEINGTEYTGFNSNGILEIGSNPLPSVGNTCTIKLK